MSRNEALRHALTNVVVAPVTPFDEHDLIDFKALRKHVGYLVDNGVTSLLAGANVSEFFSLTYEEWQAATDAIVEGANDRASVIAGISYHTETAIRMGNAAIASGAVGVMLHTPVHTHVTEAGLYAHVTALADALDVGVVLYKRGPRFSDAVLSDAVRHDNIVGVKYATNDLHRFAVAVEEGPTDITWVCGTAERWAPFFWLAGARGFTSGLANFAPRESLGLLEALRASDWDRAMQIRSQVTAFEAIRDGQQSGQNVPALKEAMNMLGLPGGAVRPPLSRLPASERGKIAAILHQWGYPVTDDTGSGTSTT